MKIEFITAESVLTRKVREGEFIRFPQLTVPLQSEQEVMAMVFTLRQDADTPLYLQIRESSAASTR